MHLAKKRKKLCKTLLGLPINEFTFKRDKKLHRKCRSLQNMNKGSHFLISDKKMFSFLGVFCYKSNIYQVFAIVLILMCEKSSGKAGQTATMVVHSARPK